jgi:hypothetical protein
MSIQQLAGDPCWVVHLADGGEVHFRNGDLAEEYATGLDGVRCIEPAQVPCWMAHCDDPACEQPEDDENGNATHIPAVTEAAAEAQLQELRRAPTGALLCSTCREPQTTP